MEFLTRHTASNIAIPQSEIAAKTSILATLAYFDIFNYPLTTPEIRQFLDKEVTIVELEKLLKILVHEGAVFCYQDYYMIQDNHLLVHRRLEGNKQAVHLLAKAGRIGRFLYQFPFVRAVGISGSLSKNFAGDKADIDFFIITKGNRLWLSRTFMHLFKKLTFLTGKQHYYCMNYYVDEHALLIDARNVYTAIELKTVLPVAGQQNMNDFFVVNKWADEWLPACEYRQQATKDRKSSIVKKLVETLFDNRFGNFLDNWLWRTTTRRWQRKHDIGKRNEKGQMMGLITGKHFARSNPGAFQEKVLALYEEKLRSL